MSLREYPILFDCTGEQLVGVATLPSQPSRMGVLIVVGGPQYRVGSHRQFVHLARFLAGEGFPSFRFDYRGMGDSTGAMRVFEDVEPDIHAAARAFRNFCPGVERLVLFGLCDAASAVLMGARNFEGLAGMILANPWVRRADSLNEAVVRHYYRQRLFSAEFWRKVASGGLPVTSVAAEFFGRVARFVTGAVAIPNGDSTPADFVDRMLVGWQLPVKRLLMMSGQDITAREFDDLRTRDKRWTRDYSATALVEVPFPQADHTFSQAEWRDAMHAHCKSFLLSLS